MQELECDRSILFISFKKGYTTYIRPTILSTILKQTMLLGYKQTNQPWTCSKLRHMISEPWQSPKHFMVGFQLTADVLLKGAQHIHQFLPNKL